ncbi:hypothetical protein RclHR1_06640015 [Rhizophagus clarus]|uniref:Forkhead box protein I2 n=3 Tax=Rhizophagus TaxID=1129544 RepID=A0A2Z6SJ49_9GLOM|nr:hypothetical protein RclHR1_06640015 [Rhizophagus clarus]GET00797.1 forkhead box protein I2 [Rhizophagus clarus]
MSRYPNVGNASSNTTTYSTSTTSIPQPLNTSRLRHEREEHQPTVSYQSPRVSSTMTTLPTLPPISTLPYDNFGPYKSPSSEQYRNSPSTPYSASSSTSSFTYLPSPLPQPSTPTQNPPSQPPHSQPSYYQQHQQQQQRSPQTSYYTQPAYSSYSQYPQQNSPSSQPSPRRTTQQLQQHYSSQQSSPIYSLQTSPHQPSSTQQSHTPIRPFQRSHTTQNVISEPFVTVTPELNNRPPRRRRRPPFSYSSLIAQAILDSPDKRLTLREVYQWIMERYPQLYKADDTGWQNTIRHNLSLNKCFKKVPRSDTELGHSTSSSAASKGKGGYWTIDPEYMSAYHDGVFARGGVQKRRPGEVHPGMGGPGLGDDDSGGSDTSPSENNNMAGRLVEVEDDNESTYHHHPHHILSHQQYHYSSHHNSSTGERIPLTLTVPSPVTISSSTSLMTPPLSSISQNKKFYVTKRHSSEPNFANLTSPSPSNYTSSVNVNASGSNSGRCDVFHLTDTTDVSNPSSDHSNSHIDISPYSVESRSSGPVSEWNISSDSSIKREVKMEIDQYYYNNHPVVGEINSSNSSVAGSMKIRNLLN